MRLRCRLGLLHPDPLLGLGTLHRGEAGSSPWAKTAKLSALCPTSASVPLPLLSLQQDSTRLEAINRCRLFINRLTVHVVNVWWGRGSIQKHGR